MQETHWGLRESPFRGCLDPNSFHPSPTHEEALARLSFLVEQHRRVGLLVGPPGSGKSLLFEVFAAQLRRHGWPVAKLSLLAIEPTEMLWMLADQWGLNPEQTASTAWLWRALGDRLTEYRYQQLAAVVLLDDAEGADRGLLEHVGRLARFDPSPEMWLTIVLAGRNEGMSRLWRPVLDLADLRIDVEPWQATDTAEFVGSALSRAGCSSPVFAEPALDRLHKLAHGIPRRVSQLADLSLLAGAGTDLEQIDAGVVESVCHELAT
ncbi:MAG: AAA family ATPase [Planctomycetaceae bacterium]|nr:AAA family ATPase [Planctomycetaceae bacterium]